jgi:polyisoprenoid-binding protein YceI
MKILLAAVFAVTTAGPAFAQNKPMSTTYNLDTEKTKIEYVGKKVTGEHRGVVKAKSGNLVATGEVLTGGEVIVDMNSMTVTDITDAKTAENFLGHMKSPDFFDTAKYPEAKLVIKNSKKTKQGLEINGDLTILGKTQPIKFTATNVASGETFSAQAKINVDRTKYGLKYGSGKFFKGLGDKMIYDEFTLDIDLMANK